MAIADNPFYDYTEVEYIREQNRKRWHRPVVESAHDPYVIIAQPHFKPITGRLEDKSGSECWAGCIRIFCCEEPPSLMTLSETLVTTVLLPARYTATVLSIFSKYF